MKTIVAISAIIFLFISILFAMIMNWRIRDGVIKRVCAYSYKPVIKRTIIHFCIVILVSLLVYVFSKSLEVTVALGALLLIATIGGCLFGLLLENQTKRRGGRKLD